MKICVCSNLFDTGIGGGSEIATQQLVTGLQLLGHKPFVISSRPVPKLTNQMQDDLSHYYVPHRNLYWVANKEDKPYIIRSLWQIQDIWNFPLYKYYLNIFSEEKPDILHSNKLRGLSVSMWTAAAKLKIPIVHTSHDYEIMSPVGHLVGKIGGWAIKGYWPISMYQTIRRRLSSLVDVFTAPSQYTLDFHTKRNFFHGSTTRVVPNTHGLSQDELSRIQTKKQDTGELRFLFLGRLDAIKGIDLLLKSFTDCAAVYKNIHLDVVGEGGNLEKEMISLYSDHPQITFHGQANGIQKWEHLKDMSVLVMPVTRRPAVFGLVVIEAYAVGKPVIASSIGGIPEVIDDQQTGLLIPPEDPKALSNAIAYFAKNPELVNIFSERCSQKAKNYSIEFTTMQYIDLYNFVSKF